MPRDNPKSGSRLIEVKVIARKHVALGLGLVFLGLLGSVSACTTLLSGEPVTSEQFEQRRLKSPQFREGKFWNSLPMDEDMWKATQKFLKGEGGSTREPDTALPVVSRTREDFAKPPSSDLRVTWLGHATNLIEIEGLKILTDPVWGERASPFSFAGPKRFFAPPLPLDQLPDLDAIILSHDHYDHLDEATVRILVKKAKHTYAPLGVGQRLLDWGLPKEQITELDWWEDVQLGAVRMVLTPARHFSGRGLRDRNKTLWGSWSLLGQKSRVFFSGDSGYFPGFREIGERLGPFDLTLMESGAYDAAWRDVHMGPEQAVAAHLDLKGKWMLPIHWATFNLALHSWVEPGERVLACAKEMGVRVALPRPGESVEPLTGVLPETRWWPNHVPWKTALETPVRASHMPEDNPHLIKLP